MKVLDLRCGMGHGFEGWYASEEEFLLQRDARSIECPMCGDRAISRLPSAPRLNLSGARAAPSQPAETPPADPAVRPPLMPDQRAHALWLAAARALMERTEDVGESFPEEARRIHYGETAERPIRGQASPEEREALQDEGIEIVSLPLPPGLKGPVQ